MGPTDIIAIILIALIVGGASFYIIRAKRRGQKCVGCPYSKQCSGGCSCNNSSYVKKKNKEENEK